MIQIIPSVIMMILVILALGGLVWFFDFLFKEWDKHIENYWKQDEKNYPELYKLGELYKKGEGNYDKKLELMLISQHHKRCVNVHGIGMTYVIVRES